MKILITGFKPFNKDKINPTSMIIKEFNDLNIKTLELDVVYNLDAKKIIDAIKEYNPNLVLMMGLAGGRKKVMIEYFALNMQSAIISDNSDLIKNHNIIDKNAPLAYATNIDVVKLKEDVNDDNFDISYHAGTFVCNDVYFQVLDFIYKNNLNIKCGFIHVPYIKEQVLEKPIIPYLDYSVENKIILKIIDMLK